MKIGWLFLLIVVFTACGNKKTSGDAGQVRDVNDFFGLFHPVRLPYTISDTSFHRLLKDSAEIGQDVLAQFVGDSVVSKYFGNNTTPKIYAVGKVSPRRAETYIFIAEVNGAKKAAYLLIFDKEKKFRAALPLLVMNNDPQTSQWASMDNRYTISINRQRKKPNGELGYKKEAYVYNNIGVFTLILTESNDDQGMTGELANPMDTLPKKNKYSGDYVKDKRNLISVRDGRRSSGIRFFVHFEKEKGTCKGELRGEAVFTKPNIAVFRQSGDPCVLELTFEANAVTMKELEGCGNYRDIKCFFEGTFPRKKENRSKSFSKKK